MVKMVKAPYLGLNPSIITKLNNDLARFSKVGG
jgi:hypothetical protein